jgi:phospholipase C
MIRNRVYRFCAAAISACLLAAGAARAANAVTDQTPAQHHIKTVFIILMENHNWTGDGNLSIKGNASAPYINNTLIPMSSYANDYNNPPGNHPSLPNYFWLEAGTNFGVKADGPPSQFAQKTNKHLVTQLAAAKVTWKAYLENISGTNCPLVDAGGADPNGNQYYAVRHNPFVYFDNDTNNQSPMSKTCIAHMRPYTELAGDLANNTVAQYNWITPNLCDDMHDSCSGNSIAHGDTWLSQNVPAILNSTAYKNGGVLFITWDEADSGDGPVPMIVLSQYAKGAGYSNSTYYDHGSTLRTLQEIFSVKPLLGDAKKQTDLSDLFSVFP